MRIMAWTTGGWYDLAPFEHDPEVIYEWERNCSLLDLYIAIGSRAWDRTH